MRDDSTQISYLLSLFGLLLLVFYSKVEVFHW